jgi:hypothetical protein
MSAQATTSVETRVPVRGPVSGSWTTGRGWYVVPIGIYAVSRLVDAVLLVLFGRSQFDPTTLPSTPGRPPLETGRSYGDLVANWDGQWYRYIVEHGYPTHLPAVDGVVQMNQWAFYPVYPALVRALTWTGLPFGPAASLVSLAFGAAAMCLLYRMLSPTLGGFGASMSVLALCVGPAALVWQIAYTESLALFLVLAALWALRSRRYGVFLLASIALAFVRPIALPMAAVAALHWYGRWRVRRTVEFPRRERLTAALGVVVTGASFLAWPLVAALVTHRRDAYFVTQRAWYKPDETGWETWLSSVGNGSPVIPILVVVGMGALLVILLRPAAKRWGPELRWWSFLYTLFVLGSTRPTTSIFRYAVLSVIPWWPFPEIGDRVTSRRGRLALFAWVLVLGILVQVVWMRWYYVIGPAALDHP